MKDNVNKEKKKEYDIVKDELVSFLGDCKIKTINFHQFGFLIMYFPVYMIIHDLEKSGINIRYEMKDEYKEKDEEIIKEMIDEDFESFIVNGQENTLQLGLCEPVLFNVEEREMVDPTFNGYKSLSKLGKETLEDKLYNKDKCIGKKPKLPDDNANNTKDGNNNRKEDVDNNEEKITEHYFIHLPFINFPPIYGISLVNNPVINGKKREKRTDGDEKNVLSIIDYWKHFSAKLSLLDKKDFSDLTVSSYPKETTANWFITKSKYIQFPSFKGITWIEHLRNEFDDLFNGIVDVAFTVQPWAALPASECHEPPLDVDMVYKNVCTEFDCTSLIFKTKDSEYLLLGDYILNCFNILLKEKIKEFYKMDSDGIEGSIRRYCKLLMEYCNDAKEQDSSSRCKCCTMVDGSKNCHNLQDTGEIDINKIEMEKGCLFENKMALRLTIDSQIYKHLEGIKADHKGMKIEEVVADYFSEKFRKHPEDFIKLLKIA